ncbi:MAG: ABC transporter ATP-binding protein [Desulfovibrio sp.]|nr:ABC transporter ATP-binding protein [Desulfovibrio sp.]
MAALYTFRNVGKTFSLPGGDLEILKNLDMTVYEGEMLGIIGASGSGKSTLLHLMGALDSPSCGEVRFENRDMGLMTAGEKAAFRNRTLGFVFQFHHLLPEFSALENVIMPALIGGCRRNTVLPMAREMLERVGLSQRMESKIATLSGGERQRVAIARAVLVRPRVLLADEPTGNLDEISGAKVSALLHDLNRELGMTLVVVTHNRELAAAMDRTLELKAGTLYENNTA